MLDGYLKKDVENYGLLRLTAAGKQFLKEPKSFMIVMDKEFKTDDVDECMVGGTSVADPELYAMLKDLRKHLARKLGIPALCNLPRPIFRPNGNDVSRYRRGTSKHTRCWCW